MEFMLRLGKSKMEKLQERFVMTDKESGLKILSQYGPEAFAMWWYVESYCYGKTNVIAFPKTETMARDLGISVRTVPRWLSKLEMANALKRVPAYNLNYEQVENLLVMNASFPEVPEEWDTFLEFGVIWQNKKEHNFRPIMPGEIRNKRIEPVINDKLKDFYQKNPIELKNVTNNEHSYNYSNSSYIKENPEKKKETNQEDREDEKDKDILDALYKHTQRIEINENASGIEFADEFFVMLKKYYPTRLHPEIVKIACLLYNQNQVSLYKEDAIAVGKIKNPTGWFHKCYKDAIRMWKAQEHAKKMME